MNTSNVTQKLTINQLGGLLFMILACLFITSWILIDLYFDALTINEQIKLEEAKAKAKNNKIYCSHSNYKYIVLDGNRYYLYRNNSIT